MTISHQVRRFPSGIFSYICLFHIVSVPLIFTEANAEAFPILEVTGETLLEQIEPAFANATGGTIDQQKVRVGFYNIEMFTDGIKDEKHRTEAKAAIQAKSAAAIIEELQVDILLISEIENTRILNILNNSLSAPFPYGYVSDFGTKSGRIEKMNIGMLSRYMPISVDEIDFGPLQGPGRPTRGHFRAQFDLGDNHVLVVYSTHLKSNYGDRNKNYSQRANAMKIMKEDAEKLMAQNPDKTWEVMILGDFNTDPLEHEFRDDPTIKILSGWTDVWSSHPDVKNIHTVPTRYGDPRRQFPPALFDRIIANPELTNAPWIIGKPEVLSKGTDTKNVKMIPGEGDHVSDHYPIFIDLNR